MSKSPCFSLVSNSSLQNTLAPQPQIVVWHIPFYYACWSLAYLRICRVRTSAHQKTKNSFLIRSEPWSNIFHHQSSQLFPDLWRAPHLDTILQISSFSTHNNKSFSTSSYSHPKFKKAQSLCRNNNSSSHNMAQYALHLNPTPLSSLGTFGCTLRQQTLLALQVRQQHHPQNLHSLVYSSANISDFQNTVSREFHILIAFPLHLGSAHSLL